MREVFKALCQALCVVLSRSNHFPPTFDLGQAERRLHLRRPKAVPRSNEPKPPLYEFEKFGTRLGSIVIDPGVDPISTMVKETFQNDGEFWVAGECKAPTPVVSKWATYVEKHAISPKEPTGRPL